MCKKYQILAPAGSAEQLTAAVNNGCDAVYLGLDCFNARLKAPNFTEQNLGQWVDFCHFFGVKVYVAVNTSIKNGEFSAAVQTLFSAYKNNADGVIVTDLALLQLAARLPKPFEVVASTQLNAHDGYGAKFLKQLGADTVVCARESSLNEISQVVQSGVNVECFLHGALCVCQSGQCLFSSMVGGNSGNRGLCAQPCRKLYHANDGKFTNGGYLLSAADICGLDTAKKMYDIGVSTFKIEGRNRRPEYAGAASRVYSEVFQNSFLSTAKQRNMLMEMFNRGNLPQCNYLFERNDGIIYPLAQNHIGLCIGKVRQNGVVAEMPLEKGDGLKIFDGKREICGALALESGAGFVPCEFSAKVRDGYIACRTSSESLCRDILQARRTRKVQIHLRALCGECATLTLHCDDVTVTVCGEAVQRARENPTTETEIATQLKKIGDLPYTISDIVSETDDIFMPKSQINGLRRRGFDALTAAIIAHYNKCFAIREHVELPQTGATPGLHAENCLAVICKDVQEISLCKNAKYIIFKPQFISENLQTDGKFVFLDLPSFSDNNYIRQILDGKHIGLVCHNIGQVQLAREMNLPYIAGLGLNIFNDNMAQIFFDAETFFYSAELSLAEISAFKNQSGLIFVDGELVLMKLVHCPYKLAFGTGCENCQAHKQLSYTDELGNTFHFARRKDKRCTFELINGKKLSVTSKLKNSGRYCVNFDEKVIDHYENLNNDTDDGYRELCPYTKGRLYNKIN